MLRSVREMLHMAVAFVSEFVGDRLLFRAIEGDADIGSYCAVPLVLSDGRPYGTLCCVSHEPDPWLKERDLGLMERTARRMISTLERGGHL